MEGIPTFSGFTKVCHDNQGNSEMNQDSVGCDDEDAGDSLDDDSSSNSSLKIQDQLDNFRSQWKLELSKNTSQSISYPKEPKCSLTKAPVGHHMAKTSSELAKIEEEKAIEMFNKGMEAEEAGQLYEAISFYKKAVQLVPDIEFRMSELSVRPNVADGNDSDSSEEEDADGKNEVEEDLIIRFQSHRQKNHGLYCLPEFQQKMAHISDLPLEVLMYILKWVVSIDLDLKSLEQISMVCRGLYLCSRDEEIWKLACIRIWGIKCANRCTYQSWRHMYLQKHHLRFNGCYISKTTYVRHGETSYVDETYRPWYLVEYYRYLHFFPEGTVLMLTTPDIPSNILPKLRFRKPRLTSVLVGHYRLCENKVTAILRRCNPEINSNINNRRRRRQAINENHEQGEQTFHLELEVEHFRKYPNYRLCWTHYAIHTSYKNKPETVANFELSPNNFPPFWFSVVRSYSVISENPLI